MRYLHDVHEVDAYRADHVCLSVRSHVGTIELENCRRYLNEIWYGRYSSAVYH